jgi:hypothetical protein
MRLQASGFERVAFVNSVPIRCRCRVRCDRPSVRVLVTYRPAASDGEAVAIGSCGDYAALSQPTDVGLRPRSVACGDPGAPRAP